MGTSEQRKDVTGEDHIGSFNFPFLKLSEGTQMFKIYSLCLMQMLHILLCVKYFIKQKSKNLLIYFKGKRRYFFFNLSN